MVLAFLALDFVLYLHHVMFPCRATVLAVPHMHHADLDCDVTTGLRFHQVEVVISMGIKLAAVILLGASPAAVLSFEVLLNATSMFNDRAAQGRKGMTLGLEQFRDPARLTFMSTSHFPSSE
jgi:sterol desaturase/sphingolipid hydroxylase (fatty acid hydroxylase superfamily)